MHALAVRAILRRHMGESYEEFLERLTSRPGLQGRAALRRTDRKRARHVSETKRASPPDVGTEITPLGYGRTGQASKVEEVLDIRSGVILTVTSHPGALPRPETAAETVVVAGKGWRSTEV